MEMMMRRGRGVRALSRGRFICCSNKISLEPGKEPEETHALLHGASFPFLVLVKIFRYRLERIRKAFQGKWKFESTT